MKNTTRQSAKVDLTAKLAGSLASEAANCVCVVIKHRTRGKQEEAASLATGAELNFKSHERSWTRKRKKEQMKV